MQKYILILSFVLFSCNQPDKQYHNEKFVIVEKGGYANRAGKFSSYGKYFLIKRVKDTTEFTELTGYNWEACDNGHDHAFKNSNGMTDSLYYNRKVGDTLFFKYIRKNRFWKKHKT